MKKILFASIITLGIGTVIAQDAQKTTATIPQTVSASRTTMSLKTTPEQSAQQRVDRLTKEVDLTKDQQKKIYDLLIQDAKEHGNRGVYNEEIEKKVNEALTPQQIAKLDQLKAERMQAMEKRNNERAKKLEGSPASKNASIAK